MILVVLGIVIFFFGLLFSIAWHELGHLATAKMFGIKVTQYMVGFGKTLFSRKRGETEYGVKAIPLGGYIRMIGMFPPKKDEEYGRTAASSPWRTMIEDARQAVAEEVRPEDAHRQFYLRNPWKRIIVMAAGPLMNLFLAVSIFAAVLMTWGMPVLTTKVTAVSECVVSVDYEKEGCPPGAPKSPAAKAGFRPGDEVVAINGKPTESWAEVRTTLRHSSGTIEVVVERDGNRITLTPTLMQTFRQKIDEPEEMVKVGFLGIGAGETILVEQDIGGVAARMGEMIATAAEAVIELPTEIPGLVGAIFGEEREAHSPVGIVGASRIGGQILALDEVSLGAKMIFMVKLLAGVNLSLFLINMLPLLPLDGGHIAGATWESIRRKFARLFKRPDPGAFDTAKLMPMAYVVSLAFIAFSLLVLVADIVNPVTLFQ